MAAKKTTRKPAARKKMSAGRATNDIGVLVATGITTIKLGNGDPCGSIVFESAKTVTVSQTEEGTLNLKIGH